jgi:glycerol-3-phosphate acyltransferase PlsY
MIRFFQIIVSIAIILLIVNPFIPGLHLPLHFKIFSAVGWGYLWGSFTGGSIFAKMFKLGDLTKIGSGNIGTTNVLRTGHKTAAILTLLFDALKAFIAIKTLAWIVPYDTLSSDLPYWTALGAIIGHVFPFLSGFSGGKGIATLAGISFTLSWPLGLFLLGLWVFVAWTTRYSSLAGIISTLGAIPLCYLLNQSKLTYFFTAVAPLILWRHKDNIHRLIEGRETKIGSSYKPTTRRTHTN